MDAACCARLLDSPLRPLSIYGMATGYWAAFGQPSGEYAFILKTGCSMIMTTLPLSPLMRHSSLSHDDELGRCSCRWTQDQRILRKQSRASARAAGRCAHSTRSSAMHDGVRHLDDSCQSSADACHQQGLQVHRRGVLQLGAVLAASTSCRPASVRTRNMSQPVQMPQLLLQS